MRRVIATAATPPHKEQFHPLPNVGINLAMVIDIKNPTIERKLSVRNRDEIENRDGCVDDFIGNGRALAAKCLRALQARPGKCVELMTSNSISRIVP